MTGRSRAATGAACVLLAIMALSFLLFEQRSSAPERVVLDVWSATDKTAMSAIVDGFTAAHPSIAINYTEYNTSELQEAVLAAREKPDLVISSAMDLQVQLV